jgi:hypothetical protein
MTLAYRKGAMNKHNPLSRRRDFKPQATFPLSLDGEVPSDTYFRFKSQPLVEDAHLNSMTVNALRLSLEFAYPIRKGYSQDSFYRDETEWYEDSRMEARFGYFWRLDRLCIPRTSELRLRLIFEPHDSSPTCQSGVYGTLAKVLDGFWWKRIRLNVKDFCERRV